MRTRSSVDLASYTEKAAADTTGESSRGDGTSSNHDRESTKLNQIIQVLCAGYDEILMDNKLLTDLW